MSPEPSRSAGDSSIDSLSRTDREIVESWLVNFDQNWHVDLLAQAADALPSPGDRRRLPALLEMVKIDLERQLSAGRQRQIEWYLEAFPELGTPETTRVELIAAECQIRRQCGDPPQREALLARFPSRAEELSTCLSDIDHEQSAGLSSPSPETASQIPGHPPQIPLASLRVRCPHCHESINVAIDSSWVDITCSLCGETFGLTDNTAARKSGGDQTVAHFELLELLGEGSSGTVWKARDLDLDRLVALKLPRTERLDVHHAEMLLREARAAAQLRHPHIVSVHEVGRDDDTLYIASDLVDGQVMSDWFKEKGCSVHQAAKLCETIALALHHAHGLGVVHRDLKPQNVLIDRDGDPHVTDFGLAQREGAELTVTLDGQVLGTPAYMSPEQAEGSAHRADCRSDVYSLGVILFQLSTGELPFRGNQQMVLHQAIHAEPPNPRRLNNNIPRDLATVCLKCMEKEPGRRYATCQDLADDLRRFLAGQPIQARPVSPIERAWRWSRRNRTLAIVGSALLATLMVVAMIAPLVALRQSRLAQEARNEAEQRRHLLYASDMERAMQAWNGGDVQRVMELLNRHTPGPGESDLRAFEWYYLWRQCQRGLRALTFPHRHAVLCVAISPDGKTIAAGSGATVRLWNTITRESTVLPGHELPVRAVGFSPDGEMLATAGEDGKIELWNVNEASHLRTLPATPWSYVWAVAFSPDGNTLAAGYHGNQIILWDAHSGHRIRRLEGHKSGVFGLSFSPDGKQLASGSYDQDALLWDLQTGEVVAKLTGHKHNVWSVSFSSDGKLLATGSLDQTVKVWKVERGELLRTLRGPHATVKGVRFLADDRLLAAAGSDNCVHIWNWQAGRIVDVLRGHSGLLWALDLSADRETLATASQDATVKLWDVASGVQRDVLLGHRRETNKIAISASGRLVATSCWGGELRIWDISTGEEQRTLKADVCSLAFAPQPQSHVLAWGTGDGQVTLWDAAVGRELHTIPAYSQTDQPVLVAFSPDGRRLASASSFRTEHQVKLWNVSDGGLSMTLDHNTAVTALTFSSCRPTLAVGCQDGIVHLHDLSGKLRTSFEAHTAAVSYLAFHPEEQILATSSHGGEFKLWDLRQRKALYARSDHGGIVWSMGVFPDGKTLFTAGADNTIKLRDLATGETRATLRDHDDEVLAVAVSPDGKTLVSTGLDKTVRIWRTADAIGVPR